ncbi:MAG: carboxypeptidase-like regulatory domain-containing protein [Paludibacteraceae bacterium]|nr:carboxypeptidase-like regulatory domain-containing protein [Paludibacteraceae bacterium]
MVKRFSYIVFMLLCFAGMVMAQEDPVRTSISGVVVDGDTGETLPFVQIYFLKSTTNKGVVPSEVGTTSDVDGNFSISNTQGYTSLNFQMIGFKTELLTLRKGQNRKGVKVKMTPDVYGLQDIVVTPKNRKREYRRKGNPAVELIKNVIANKDKHCVLTADQYKANSYARMSFALDNIKVNWNKPFWKDFQFVKKYIDTTGVYPNVTVSIREHLNTEYYQRKPHREKKVLDKKRIFGIESVIGSESFQKNVDAIFKDVDINDNSMNLLFNRFVSPLSSTIAVTFYQYYIMDTIMVDGYPCIDLAFVPVNSESYGFTGHLYIVNDSTYRLKKYTINVPPEINLNFVSNFSIEHSYKQLDNGLWAPDRTTTYAKFYIFNNKRGMLARQTKIYTAWDLETPIPKETFSPLNTGAEAEKNDSTAELVWEGDWTDEMRPEPLTKYESSVVDLVREFTNTPKFNSLALFVNAVTTEYVPTRKAEYMYLSKFDFGPIYNFISWNMLEGVRLRVGGISTARLHDQIFFRGYVAFGTKDLLPKYSGTFIYTFGKHEYHPYDGRLKHHIQLTGQYDIEEPGQLTDVVRRDNIIMSIPFGTPTMPFAQYVFHAKLEYMKEWRNNMILSTHFDFTNNRAAGSLRYDRVDWTQHIDPVTQDTSYTKSTTPIGSYRNYEAMIDFEYSPGSTIGMDRAGVKSPWTIEKDAPTIKLTHTIGYLDDRHNGGKGFFYNKTEVMFDKRFWFSAFGHLDLRVQTGIIWQQVPFTKLHIPPTSTSILLGQRAFNLMKPMEFMMDEYVSLYMTYYFKGWILNRIPGINKLKLRGVVSFAGIYGGLTKKNNPYLETGSGLYEFPQTATFDKDGYYVSGTTSSPIGKLPYLEITAGFENIFKFIRIDYIRRLTYNEYELPYKVPQLDGAGNPMIDPATGEPIMIQARRRIPGWGRNGVKVTVRFSL